MADGQPWDDAHRCDNGAKTDKTNKAGLPNLSGLLSLTPPCPAVVQVKWIFAIFPIGHQSKLDNNWKSTSSIDAPLHRFNSWSLVPSNCPQSFLLKTAASKPAQFFHSATAFQINHIMSTVPDLDHSSIEEKPPELSLDENVDTDGINTGNPSARRRANDTQPNIETLLVELQSQILYCLLDLETLRSAIHASPILRATYLFDRGKILRHCLNRELGHLVIDAYTTVVSRPSVLPLWKPHKKREMDESKSDQVRRAEQLVKSFLDDYYDWVWNWKECPDLLKSLPLDMLEWLASYHLHVVRPDVRHTMHVLSLPALLDIERRGLKTTYNHMSSRNREICLYRGIYRKAIHRHFCTFLCQIVEEYLGSCRGSEEPVTYGMWVDIMDQTVDDNLQFQIDGLIRGDVWSAHFLR